MEYEKALARQYSINVARLRLGKNQEIFEVDKSFFDQFELTQGLDGAVNLTLDMIKYETHIDAHFRLTGTLQIPCDRCGEPYPFDINTATRIIYSFDPDMRFDHEEVIHVDETEPRLVLIQEIHDFIQTAIPIRKVPPADVHLCSPDILRMLGLDEKGEPLEEIVEEEEVEIDPRWAALKKLKDQEE
ncbi:MAG: DUF177 domain-containing protein [Bacteroidota bacterium]